MIIEKQYNILYLVKVKFRQLLGKNLVGKILLV